MKLKNKEGTELQTLQSLNIIYLFKNITYKVIIVKVKQNLYLIVEYSYLLSTPVLSHFTHGRRPRWKYKVSLKFYVLDKYKNHLWK